VKIGAGEKNQRFSIINVNVKKYVKKITSLNQRNKKNISQIEHKKYM